jgi:hypothetical protein
MPGHRQANRFLAVVTQLERRWIFVAPPHLGDIAQAEGPVIDGANANRPNPIQRIEIPLHPQRRPRFGRHHYAGGFHGILRRQQRKHRQRINA